MNLLEKISIYLYCLIPLFLITGPLLPDLSVVIISIFFFYLIIKNKNYYYLNNKYFLIFLSFCILIIFKSLLSENVNLSLTSSSFYIRFGLFSLAIWMLLEKDLNFIFILKNIFLLIIIALFIDTIVQFLFGKNLLGFEYVNPQNFRITSFFGDDEVLGSYVARFFPFIISLIAFHEYRTKKKINKIFFVILILIIFILVFLSGERTSFALLSISSILIFLSCKNLRKYFVLSFFSALIVITIISHFNPKIKQRMFDHPIELLGFKKGNVVIFSKTYEGHYKISLNMFKEKPIFGHGVKMFRVYCQKPENFIEENKHQACSTHPHNVYMQFLAETGIIGFIYLLSVFLIISYFILKNIYTNIFKGIQCFSDYKVCIFIFYFVTLFPLAPSGNFFNNWLSIIYYLPAGYLLYLNKNDLKKNEL